MKKKFVPTLQIDEELQSLLPPLSEEESAGLEANILEHGVLSPIIVWNGVIIDGHYRYRICKKHNIPFTTIDMFFDSVNDAKFWIWQHQEHRRNLTPYQRTVLALRFKTIIAAKARENRIVSGCNRKSEEAKSSKVISRIRTDDEVAKLAGVSRNTVNRVEFLQKHADEPTKQLLYSGETTINAAYRRIKDEKECQQDDSISKNSVVGRLPVGSDSCRDRENPLLKTDQTNPGLPEAKWSRKPPTKENVGQWFLYIDDPGWGDRYFGYKAHIAKANLGHLDEIMLGSTYVCSIVSRGGCFYGPIPMPKKLEEIKSSWEEK